MFHFARGVLFCILCAMVWCVMRIIIVLCKDALIGFDSIFPGKVVDLSNLLL